MKYKGEVHTYGDPAGNWCSNALTFDTPEEAEACIKDLFMRWTAVEYWRVVEETYVPGEEKVYASGP